MVTRIRENILDYKKWCSAGGSEVFRTLRQVRLFLSSIATRTVAHVQVPLEEAGFTLETSSLSPVLWIPKA